MSRTRRRRGGDKLEKETFAEDMVLSSDGADPGRGATNAQHDRGS